MTTDTPIGDLTVAELLDGVASHEVTPSGGALAGVSGAAGAALCEMTCLHTVASTERDDEETTERLERLSGELADHRARLLALADEDVAAVEAVQAAFESADSVEETTVQDAAERATESPIQIARACHDVLETTVVVTDLGAPNAVPDAATGGSLAHAGLRAGVWTARSNLDLLADAEFVADASGRLDELDRSGTELVASVEANVRETW